MTNTKPSKPEKKAGRPRRQITITSINEPDPEIVAMAFAPLLFDLMKRERERLLPKEDSTKI